MLGRYFKIISYCSSYFAYQHLSVKMSSGSMYLGHEDTSINFSLVLKLSVSMVFFCAFMGVVLDIKICY